jgi:hypothetical protein
MKTIFRLVGGTDVDPTLLESGQPKRKRGCSSGNVPGIDYLPDNRPPAGSLSTTAENWRIRQERHDVWRMADAATRYWRVRLDLEGVVSRVQRMGAPEGRSHPAINPDDRWLILEKYRAALVKQLLTPCVYRESKFERIDDEVRPVWRANL